MVHTMFQNGKIEQQQQQLDNRNIYIREKRIRICTAEMSVESVSTLSYCS